MKSSIFILVLIAATGKGFTDPEEDQEYSIYANKELDSQQQDGLNEDS